MNLLQMKMTTSNSAANLLIVVHSGSSKISTWLKTCIARSIHPKENQQVQLGIILAHDASRAIAE